MKLFNSITLLFFISLTSLAFTQSTPFKLDKEMIQIHPTYHSVEVEVGEKLYYSTHMGAADFAEGKAWSENESLLKLNDVHLDQELNSSSSTQKEKKILNETIKTYVFQALKPGECNILFEESYNEKIISEYKVKTIIVEKGHKKPMEFVQEFYENGNLKSSLPVYDTLNKTTNGLVKLLHENGNLLLEGTIKDQSKSGEWKFYNENGKLSYSGEYESDMKIGEWLAYDVNEEVLFKETKHDYINNINQYRYENSTFKEDRSQIYFTNKQNELAPYSEKENGNNYRIIDFKENQPLYNRNFKHKNKDLSIINGDWGQVEIKFHQKVKYIKVEYFDDGCSKPFTEFKLKNSVKKEIYFSKNTLFMNQNFILNTPETLSKMTFFEISHCEGITDRIIIIYE